MSTWPIAPFPQTPERNGYADDESNSVIRSPVGYGPAKVRERTTAVLDNIVAQFTLTDAQKATYEQFYADNKTLRFDWDDTLGGGTLEYRFRAPPRYQEVTCDVWKMQVQLERLP